MPEERIVVVGYRPKPGKGPLLEQLLKTHVDRLRKEGLISERQPIIAQASDGTYLEVFGWKSPEAIDQAHTNLEVQKMWEEFSEVCEYVPVGQLSEMSELFSEFKGI